MRTHLSADELTAALEAQLGPPGEAHLRECEVCRGMLEQARAALKLVSADATPEPSPLFWEHFAARVRQATTGAAVPQRSWWQFGSVASLAAAAATLLLALGLLWRPAAPPPASETVSTARVAAEPSETVSGWDEVVSVAEQLSAEELRDLAWVEPVGLIADLTPEEQVVFVELLRAEMGVGE
jgi:hypothetical protein